MKRLAQDRFGVNRDFSHLRDGISVLVEEEAAIRSSWIQFFEKCGMKLLVFDSGESFISDFRSQGDPVEFFFDQDFGQVRGVGTKLASYVQTWPERTGSSLVTSYLPEEFEYEVAAGIINAVLPKFPAQIFGEDHYSRHIDRQIKEQGLDVFIRNSFDRIQDAFERLDAAKRNISRSMNRGSGGFSL